MNVETDELEGHLSNLSVLNTTVSFLSFHGDIYNEGIVGFRLASSFYLF